MSVIAHKLKKGMYIFNDKDNKVYVIHGMKQSASKSGGNGSVHLSVQDFETDHMHPLMFSHDHKVRIVEPEHNTYLLVNLLDETKGKLYISLTDDDGDLREDMYVSREHIISYLQEYFKDDKAKPLSIYVTSVKVDALHRKEKNISMEKITRITGVDMKHLYDKHHGHHHDHKVKHVLK